MEFLLKITDFVLKIMEFLLESHRRILNLKSPKILTFTGSLDGSSRKGGGKKKKKFNGADVDVDVRGLDSGAILCGK